MSRRLSVDDQLARVREVCLALPEATEKTAWGAPTFRVRDKLFAMFADHHHGDPRIALWLNAPPGAQDVLVGSEPRRFFVPPYMGPRGWIALDLAENTDAELRLHVREAWGRVAPKKLLAQLEGEPPPKRGRRKT